MKIKIILLAFSFLFVQLQAQDFVDIVRVSTNFATMGNVDNDVKSFVNNQNIEFYYPKRLNKKLVVLAGFTFENTTVNLFDGNSAGNLFMARLNLGIKHQHSERWAGTYVFLPKIASNFQGIGSQDFQFGGLAVIDYKISDNWKLKFGVYTSSENHGSTITPLLGVWHRSKNGKFYINATLPIRMDINYNFVKGFSMGADLLTSVKSYDLSKNATALYVQEESIRAALYASYGFLDKSLILRARAGLDFTDYGLYNSNDKIGAQLLIFPLSGDNRNRLNPEYMTAFYFGIDLIYRFDLSKENN